MIDDCRDTENHEAENQDESPPGFRSWRSVYAAVFGCFVLYVVLLFAFTVAYS